MKKCLSSVISEKKSAFIKDRLLTDNVLIAFEENHYMKRRTQGKTGIVGLKINISKTYYRLEWGFIYNIMSKYGFHELWINRVKKFIHSVSYNFLHNGDEFGSIIPGRGLRQGDPIFPCTNILYAEGLSVIIRRDEEADLIHECTIAK